MKEIGEVDLSCTFNKGGHEFRRKEEQMIQSDLVLPSGYYEIHEHVVKDYFEIVQ